MRTYGESDAKAGTVSKGQIGQIERERKVWGKAIRVESDAVMEEALVMADRRTEDDVATTHNVEHAYIREMSFEELMDRASGGRLECRKAEIGRSR